MQIKTLFYFLILFTFLFFTNSTIAQTNLKTKITAKEKVDTIVVIPQDTLKIEKEPKLKFYKKNVHASYYADKFNGRKTASGAKFNNNGYTAAHKKLPFGTKVKVTNGITGRFVIVEINDRGPYAKSREIDLTKKAFMEIVDKKNRGFVPVTIEIIEE